MLPMCPWALLAGGIETKEPKKQGICCSHFGKDLSQVNGVSRTPVFCSTRVSLWPSTLRSKTIADPKSIFLNFSWSAVTDIEEMVFSSGFPRCCSGSPRRAKKAENGGKGLKRPVSSKGDETPPKPRFVTPPLTATQTELLLSDFYFSSSIGC